MDVKPYVKILIPTIDGWCTILHKIWSGFPFIQILIIRHTRCLLSSTLILKIRSKLFSHRESFVCWLFFPAARGIWLWNVISCSFFTQMTRSKKRWECQEVLYNSSQNSTVNQATPWGPELSKSLSVRLWAVLPYLSGCSLSLTGWTS